MSPRTLPTSRAYWDLRAEQVMDRVFTPVGAADSDAGTADEDPASPIDVLVRDEGPSAPAHRAGPSHAAAARSGAPGLHGPAERRRRWAMRPWPSTWSLRPTIPTRSRQVLALSSVVCLTMGSLSLVLWRNWTVARQDLRQERNLLLLERLRALGPAAETTPGANQGVAQGGPTSDADASKGDLASAEALPPPPSEPWMEELTSLPASSAPPAEVLRVPVNSAISRPAPPASTSSSGGGSRPAAASGGSLPQLVGVVQVPGRAGSAIFQMGGSSSSAAVGESIGGSGWRLRSASGDTAVIERGGEQRQVSISSGF